MRALMHLLTKLGPMYLMDPRTGQDVVGGYGGTLEGGATANVEMPGIKGGGRAISLDGTNDYVSTTFGTRRNLCTNPSFETGTTGWTLGGASWASSSFTRVAGSYTGSTGSYYARLQGTKDATGTQRALYIYSQPAATAGTTYTFSAYLNVIDAPATGFNLQIDWYNGGAYLSSSVSDVTPVTGAQRLSLTATAPANTTMATIYAAQAVTSTSGDTVDYYVDAILFEQASSAGDYFDGSGHVASGTWVSDGLTGWLGTAHASSSDCGVFANGTTRTFVAAVQPDALSTDMMVVGAAEGAIGAYIHSSDVPAFTADSSSIFNVASGGALTAGQPSLIAWEFNEPASLLRFVKDGATINTPANTDQFGARKTLQIGAYGGTTSFDGLIGPVAIFDRALTAEEHHEIEKTGLAGRFG